MARIAMLGSGNVAWHLGPALQEAGHEIVAIWSRNSANAEELATTLHSSAFTSISDLPEADLYLIMVADRAISEVVLSLAQAHPEGQVAHTSGSIGLSVYDQRRLKGGVFYPLQTFSRDEVVDISKVPFCLEAKDEDYQNFLLAMASELSDSVQLITSEERARLHLAAVFACNFSNHFYAIAEQLLQEQNLELDLLRPLITETARKAQHNAPAKVQTGPAQREDKPVLNAHLDQLSSHPEWQKIYTLVSKSIRARKHET